MSSPAPHTQPTFQEYPSKAEGPLPPLQLSPRSTYISPRSNQNSPKSIQTLSKSNQIPTISTQSPAKSANIPSTSTEKNRGEKGLKESSFIQPRPLSPLVFEFDRSMEEQEDHEDEDDEECRSLDSQDLVNKMRVPSFNSR